MPMVGSIHKRFGIVLHKRALEGSRICSRLPVESISTEGFFSILII